jgi:hypothetical protein
MKSNLTPLKVSLLPAAVVLATIILGSSCQKSDKQVSSVSLPQQKLVVTNSTVDATNDDEENFDLVMEDQNIPGSANVSDAVAGGRTITYSPSKDVYPHTKTIDYGTGFRNGIATKKSGKVIITYFDPKADASGKFAVTTYDNYYSNGVHIEGSIQVNKIKNGSGQQVYLHLIDKTMTDANGNVKSFKCNSKWTVIDWQGGSQNAYQKDEHATGTETDNGIESHFVIDTDSGNLIIKPFDCKRVQGALIATINLGKGTKLDEVLDYGNGVCDDIATLTVNGVSSQVTLPLNFWPLN